MKRKELDSNPSLEREAKKIKEDFFCYSSLEDYTQPGSLFPSIVAENVMITSSNAESLAERVLSDSEIRKAFGMNVDVMSVRIEDVDDQIIESTLSKTVFGSDPSLVSNYLQVIQQRLICKVGENLSCDTFNRLLFSEDYFLQAIDSSNKQIIIEKGKCSNSNDGVVSSISKSDLGLKDEEKSFNLVLYYISQILLNQLEPNIKLELDLTNLFSTEDLEKFGFSFIELFRIEAKESNEDFTKVFLKVVLLAMRQCLQMMQILFEKTGYIYPIRAPSLTNAGSSYRISLTSVLPSSLLDYLKNKEDNIPEGLSNIKISHVIDSIIKRRDILLKKMETNIEGKEMENDLELINIKIKYLEAFFPQFLRDQSISIENSAFCGSEFVYQDDLLCFKVNCDKDVKKLVYNCIVTSKYILKLVEMMGSELNLSISCQSNYLQEMSLPPMNCFSHRFKQISKNDRSTVHFVQIKTDNGWIDHEVIKQYQTQLPYQMEKRFNMLVKKDCTNTRENTLIMSVAQQCVVNDETNLFNLLQSMALVLQPIHHNNIVHGDIKPEHILKNNDQICLIDFEFSNRIGKKILGCTKGFHPPEFDEFPNNHPVSSTTAEIYSVALSGLYLLYLSKKKDQNTKKEIGIGEKVEIGNKTAMDETNNCQTQIIDLNTWRNDLANLVDYIVNQKLKSILEKMLKRNPDERIKNATELMNEINKIDS